MIIFGIISLIIILSIGIVKFYSVNEVIKYDLTDSIGIQGLPIVKIEIENKLYNFLVDTGANECYIDSNVLPTLTMYTVEGNSTYMDASGNQNEVSIVTVRTKFLDTNINCSMHSYDMSKVNEKYTSEGFPVLHGILGTNFLMANKLVIDFSYLSINKFL